VLNTKRQMMRMGGVGI